MRQAHFNPALYRRCCDESPRFKREQTDWAAVCTKCGRTVKQYNPANLAIAWNRDVSQGMKK